MNKNQSIKSNKGWFWPFGITRINTTDKKVVTLEI